MDSYYETRDKIILSYPNCTEEDLHILKHHFKDQIASIRTLENVRNISDLITVLEKRYALNINDFKCFDEINKCLPRNVNVKPTWSAAHTSRKLTLKEKDIPNRSVLGRTPSTTREQIYKLISTQIGGKWKEFGRALGINEQKIDELAEVYPKIQDRVQEILLYYEEQPTSGTLPWIDLMSALNKSRRNDLRDQMEKILKHS